MQSVRLSAPSLTAFKRIDLAVEPRAILNVVDTAGTKAVADSASSSALLRELAVLLLCPPAPFVNSLAQPVLLAKEELLADNVDAACQRQRQILASVLAAAIPEIALTLFNGGLLLQELMEARPLESTSADSFEVLEHALAFWGSASQDRTVRAKLQEQRLPFVLYQLLRRKAGTPSKAEGGMLASLPAAVVTGVVDLIKGLVVGHTGLEAELADLLIEDLEHLSEQRDMDFVNKVFLPLIKVEKAVPVTLGPARSNAESGQGAILSGISSLVESGEATTSGPSSFLASALLAQQQKNCLKLAFEQIVGDRASKAQAQKLLDASWSKVHAWSASSAASTERWTDDLALWRLLEHRGPCVLLTSGRSERSGRPAVFGAFWQAKVPKVPSLPAHADPSSCPAHELDATEGDFCFCYQPAQASHHHFTPAEDLPLAQIAVQDEDGVRGVGLTIGGSFLVAGYGCEFEQGICDGSGCLEELDEVTVVGVPTPLDGSSSIPEDFTIEASEIWVLEPGHQPESANQSKASEKDSEQTRLTSLTRDCIHPWVLKSSPYNLFRAAPVYMVPAHLSVKAAVQILLKREGEAGISSSFMGAPIADLQELTVGQLYEQFLADADGAQELNQVLDLKYDRQKVIRDTTEIEGLKKLDTASSDGTEGLSEQIAAYYVPEMSFFAQFEAKGGVTKIITVTLASLTLWRAGALAASWRTWLQDLSAFSQIPLFF